MNYSAKISISTAKTKNFTENLLYPVSEANFIAIKKHTYPYGVKYRPLSVGDLL